MTVQFHRTGDESHQGPSLLTDGGQWKDDLPDKWTYLSEQFPNEDDGHGFYGKSDPRQFMRGEEDSVAMMDGYLGILTEVELDAVVTDDRSSASSTTEYTATEYAELVKDFKKILADVQERWDGRAEIFLADGPSFYDHRLVLCGFVPLVFDDQSNLILGEGMSIEDIHELHSELMDIVFEPA